MKPLLIASLVLAQAAPATAASLHDEPTLGQQRIGTFAGARLRVPLGGERSGKVSAGLGIAGVSQSRAADGATALRFSEGVQLGYSADRKLGLTIAGKPLKAKSSAAQNEEGQDADDDGISTLGWVGIVAGGALIIGGIGLALFIDAMNDASE
jgi:hypothetical protein